MRRLILFWAIWIGLVVISTTAQSQVLIYNLKLSATEDSPDFEFYDGGWIMVDTTTNKTSFVFTSHPSSPNNFGKGRFIESVNTGKFFYGGSGDSLFANVKASSKDGVAEASYLLSGKIDTTTTVLDPATKKDVSMAVPETLKGFLLASDAEFFRPQTDSENELMGMVGILKLESKLEQKATEYFNRNEVPLAEVIDLMVSDLLAANFLRDE